MVSLLLERGLDEVEKLDECYSSSHYKRTFRDDCDRRVDDRLRGRDAMSVAGRGPSRERRPRTDEFVQPRGIVNYFPSDGGIWGGGVARGAPLPACMPCCGMYGMPGITPRICGGIWGTYIIWPCACG